MFRRPSLRSTVTTLAAAVVLVGGAGLASYAATGHGHTPAARATAGSVPKTLKFHLGAPGKVYQGNTRHLFSVSVPKGVYEIGMNGLVSDGDASGIDNYTCLVADEKDLVALLSTRSPSAPLERFYDVGGHDLSDFNAPSMSSTNTAQKIDRSKVAYGCLFNGTGPFTIERTVTFTLRPIKVTNGSGTPITITRTGARRLTGLGSHAVAGLPALGGQRSGAPPKSYQIVLGHTNAKYTDSAFVTGKIPPGSYQISLSGQAVPDVPGDSLRCVVSDKTYWIASHPHSSLRWASDWHPSVDIDGATVNAVGAAKIKKGVRVALGCVFGSPTWTLAQPFVATLTQVRSLDKVPTHVFRPDRAGRRGGR